METREYAQGTTLLVSMPWGLFRGGRAMCPDGKVRAIKRIAITADTFFSVPAAVEVYKDGKNRTVAGYVTVQAMSGRSVATDDDPEVVRFYPYTYRKNAWVFRNEVGE